MKASVVSKIHARHPNAIKFNSKVDQLVSEREQVVAELARESKEKYEEAGKQYTYRVVSAAAEPFLPKSLASMEPVRVIRTWANKRAWDSIAEYYGHVAVTSGAVDVSPLYYRVNGVLVHEGNGAQVIQSHKPCSDSDWEILKQGDINNFI